MWTIKSRNDRVATHLTITNYEPGLGLIRTPGWRPKPAQGKPYAPKTRWTSSRPATRASMSSVVE